MGPGRSRFRRHPLPPHSLARSVRVIERMQEAFRGETLWKGDVEAFAITGHPKAERCYAWSHADGKTDSDERFVAVLEIPPVESPETAVRASIVADSKNRGIRDGCP